MVPPAASGEYGAAKAAILASDDCTDTDRLLLCIPDIAEKQGWVELGSFLRKWFAAPASTDRDAAEPSFVEWDWLRIHEETLEAWNTITDPEYLFFTVARTALFNTLIREYGGALPAEASTFDHTVLPFDELHDKHFQHVVCNTYGIDTVIHGMTAAMGAFTLYAVAKGSVKPTVGGHRITVTGLSIFVRDSFDFEDWQPLGSWNCDRLSFEGGVGTTNVYNSDFSDFRTRHGYGGDYWVYALPRSVDAFEDYSYEVEL